MSWGYPYFDNIDLHVQGRISEEDAKRQADTACEILRRLRSQPGLILADEVGMGKTFVALAVAASMALTNRCRPVVVMVPSTLKEKWPRDFELFREKCLPADRRGDLSCASVENGITFLKRLDDPPERMKSIIFLTHGAMSRQLNDGWVKLAIIQAALHQRKNIDQLRKATARFAGDLVQMKGVGNQTPGVWGRLLAVPPERWLHVLHSYGIDPEGDYDLSTDDDPVPKAIRGVLASAQLNLEPVFHALRDYLPQKQSKNIGEHLKQTRQVINVAVRELWQDCISSLRDRLPLLIMDEAHHLKNARTRLASLFQAEDAQSDAEEMRGPFNGVFERMLFLTATPFQLGHHELCSVLDRFDSINWRGNRAPQEGQLHFKQKIEELRRQLDSAQAAAIRLDTEWGHLRAEDLMCKGQIYPNVEMWWNMAQTPDAALTATAQHVVSRYHEADVAMRKAEHALRPWIIRHSKPQHFPHSDRARRQKMVGRSIIDDVIENGLAGLQIEEQALLPFLLAARATMLAPESRPVFAEGLASSYEAFLHTRQQRLQREQVRQTTDNDDEGADTAEIDPAADWYLDQLKRALPKTAGGNDPHPKVSVTVQRTVELWRRREKVIIFCHYIATGRALRQQVSLALTREITSLGAKKLGCSERQVFETLDRIGKRFFDEDSPVRRACDHAIQERLRNYPALVKHEHGVIEVVRRNLRTPSFLVRYLPLKTERLTTQSIEAALREKDDSGRAPLDILDEFFKFLAIQCGEQERWLYIEAIRKVQTGSHTGADVRKTFSKDERQGDRSERLIPNVRLVNGDAMQETRQRLMLTFNTPFYPEVLIASSVMAEGVDLHLNCRHVIHHDLCWNPSMLEQRTGRVDRIGCKGEISGKPILVYLPYVAETQDEKMFRVVMDRERWFRVVMGEQFSVDTRTTEQLAERIPFPEIAAKALAFRLEISPSGSGT